MLPDTQVSKNLKIPTDSPINSVIWQLSAGFVINFYVLFHFVLLK